MDPKQTSETESLYQAAQQNFEPRLITHEADGTKATILVLPEGLEGQDMRPYIDKALPFPRRRRGTAKLETLAAFIDHTNRFKDAGSAVFAHADQTAPTLTSVLDYHDAENPRWGEHRGVYAFPLSPAWLAWMAVSGKFLLQEAFAEFVEARIADVLAPEEAVGSPSALAFAEQIGCEYASPARLMTLSRGLAINVGRKVVNRVSLTSGEGEVSFSEDHSDTSGAPIKVPGALLLKLAVFRSGAAYKVPVRLRYRVFNGSVSWSVELQRTDVIFEDAFNEAIDSVRAKTELPIFFGAPES
jgi:uncharacterized protein YfdQ (DUF2303 family)